MDAVLNRLGIALRLPFRSRSAYERYVREMKSDDLDDQLHIYRTALASHERSEAVAGYRGVTGDVRNLIFAARYKPELILRDVTQGIVEITKNKPHCLLYDRPVTSAGLTMAELVDWWGVRDGEYGRPRGEQVARLYARLADCTQSKGEKALLNAYWSFAQSHGFEKTPAILSQVYLHYDPVNQEDRDAQGGRVLLHQRMDFLLLAPGGRRFLLEVDGRQHYGEGPKSELASRNKYAAMVAEDRELRLKGYEVYRFGTQEFDDARIARAMLGKFFARLLDY
ncbi:hypothetical protein [Streptomyces microflavus]|uniref:hypothetical protein n=1 Tax=Streptomyces microflavus TaxID=1919 RepID=UPI0036CFE0F8